MQQNRTVVLSKSNTRYRIIKLRKNLYLAKIFLSATALFSITYPSYSIYLISKVYGSSISANEFIKFVTALLAHSSALSIIAS